MRKAGAGAEERIDEITAKVRASYAESARSERAQVLIDVKRLNFDTMTTEEPKDVLRSAGKLRR